MPRLSTSLEGLENLMTIENADPLTPDAVMDRYWDLIQQQKATTDAIEEVRSVLSLMRRNGLIGDEMDHPAFTLKWQSRSTWVYSNAVKELQGLEKVDGSATKKTSEGWTARPTKPQL